MESQHIDFISSYCDRWCERCALTDRCSAFACNIAIAMCGDAVEGLELAVGRPKSPEGDDSGPRWEIDESVNAMPSPAEMALFERDEKARDVRIDASPLARMSTVYRRRATAWIAEHRVVLDEHTDPNLHEAFETVSHDAFFIGVKIHRALDGRDRSQRGEEGFDDDPVQNDWNGSAKVALISIERSASAWRRLGKATQSAAATVLADALDVLRRSVLTAFPDAVAFRRPGFDDGPDAGRAGLTS
jgi:hypothetical protein